MTIKKHDVPGAPAKGRFWPSMYWRRIVMDAPPHGPHDVAWGPKVPLLLPTLQHVEMAGNSCFMRRDETPLRLFTNSDSRTFGG